MRRTTFTGILVGFTSLATLGLPAVASQAASADVCGARLEDYANSTFQGSVNYNGAQHVMQVHFTADAYRVETEISGPFRETSNNTPFVLTSSLGHGSASWAIHKGTAFAETIGCDLGSPAVTVMQGTAKFGPEILEPFLVKKVAERG